MMKNFLIHGGWLAVAAIAFAFGRSQKAEPTQGSANETVVAAPSILAPQQRGAGDAAGGGATGAGGADSRIAAGAERGVELHPSEISGVVREALNDPNPLKRNLAFSKLLEGLTAENAEDIRKALEDGRAGRDQWRLFRYAWGAKDPEAAIAFAESLEGRGRMEAMSETISGWASASAANATAAATYVASLELEDERQRQGLIYSLVSGMADYDIGYATNYVFQLAEAGDEQAGRYMDTVTREKLRFAGYQDAAVWAAALPDGDLKGSALDTVAGDYVHRGDPAQAAAWAEQFATADYGVRVIEEVGDEWAERDPEASVAWLNTLPDGRGKAEGTYSAFREWTQRDAVAASEYLAAMPDSASKDYAVSGFAQTLARQDPESAVAWASTINEEDRRVRTLTRTAQEWFRRDAEAAKEWLATSGLPAETQKEITAPREQRRDWRGGRG